MSKKIGSIRRKKRRSKGGGAGGSEIGSTGGTKTPGGAESREKWPSNVRIPCKLQDM